MSSTRPPFVTLPPQPATAVPQPPPAPDPRERIARFKVITRRALGHWKVGFLLFALCAGVAVFFASRVKRVYKSEAVVLFKAGMTHNNDEPPAERALRLAPKLKDMLITRQRLEPIILENKLYPRIVESRGMLDAVEEMRNHIGLRGRDSETFVISFDAESDPEVTQTVTQRLANSVIDDFTRTTVSASKSTADFLAVEERRSSEELESANKGLATFLAAHPEFAMEARNTGQGGAGMPGVVPAAAFAAAQSGTDPVLSSLLRQRARIEQEARAATGQPPPPGLPPGTAERLEALGRAREEAIQRAAAAQADLASKKAMYTDQHPDLIAARQAAEAAGKSLQQAEAALAQARAASTAGVNPYEPPPNSLTAEQRQRLDAVNAQIVARQAELKAMKPADRADAAANGLVELETEWQRLLRAVRDGRSAHEDIKTKLDKARLQASAVAATSGDKLEILDAAFLPSRPIKGGRTNAALAGLAVAFILAVAYAYARVLFSDVVVDAGDIQALHVIPVLGVMPKIPAATGTTLSKRGGSGGVV